MTTIGVNRVWSEVLTARRSAAEKLGTQSIENLAADDSRWLPILVQRMGGIANALTAGGMSDLRAQLISTLAVLSVWVDRLDQAAADIPRLAVDEAAICPGDPGHLIKSHWPGGFSYGVPIDHGAPLPCPSCGELLRAPDAVTYAGWTCSACKTYGVPADLMRLAGGPVEVPVGGS